MGFKITVQFSTSVGVRSLTSLHYTLPSLDSDFQSESSQLQVDEFYLRSCVTLFFCVRITQRKVRIDDIHYSRDF